MNAAKKAQPRVNKQPAPTPVVRDEPTPAPVAETPAPQPEQAKEVVLGNPKQWATLAVIRAGWEKRGVDLSQMKMRMDGKFLVIVVGEGWPEVTIGNGGGANLPQIKSYPSAIPAAIEADALWQKQQAKGQPKPATAPAIEAPAKKEDTKTPAARKAEEHQKIEDQLSA